MLEAFTLSEGLLPEDVVVHGLRLAEPTDEVLTWLVASGVQVDPSLAQAILKRRAQFVAGRFCARAALRTVAPEVAERAVGIAENREPAWPAGVVGSVSHTHGYVAAAVARADALRGVGIDFERWVREESHRGIASHVARDGELDALVARTGWSLRELVTLVFSAKESVYKCLYPEVQRWFGFHDARVIDVDVAGGAFVAELTVALTPSLPAGTALAGRFEVLDGALVTAITRR